MNPRSGVLKSLGPGFLFAAVSVGVSHLVQCTRAGAGYGFTLVGVILLALILKYPLFEFGQRYAAATGTSLLEGYRRQGRWSLALFLVLTLGTMFTVLAAVTFVTTGLAVQLTGLAWSTTAWSAMLIAAAALVLVVGRFRLLDAAIKVIMVILTLSTVLAAALALPRLAGVPLFGPVTWRDIGFVVGLVGWMPTGVDVSVWQSVWTLARRRDTGHAPTLREALLDFRIGYVGTGVLALLFVTLGTAVMFAGGVEFSSSAPAFARQVIDLYARSLGEWSRPLITVAAFTTMFSTLLTVIDGFPRALDLLRRRFRGPETPEELLQRAGRSPTYWAAMLALAAGALLINAVWIGGLASLIDLATVLSFATAPFLGLLTYRAVTAHWVPEEMRPPCGLRILAVLGIVFLGAFLVFFLVSRLLIR